MNKLMRLYRQNRMQFWVMVIIIVFILIIIRLLNFWSGAKIQEEARKAEENQNKVSYEEESHSIISGGKVKDSYQEEFGQLIDNFLKNCVAHQYEEAYELLSEECKKELYPSKKLFIDQYCSEKFDGNKSYKFQSWTSADKYIYLIKIYENILSTGNAETNYIQDYYTIVEENGEYKLNISSFIGKTAYQNKQKEQDGMVITVNDTCQFMDYQEYEFTLKNNTENIIMLNSREKTDEVYLINSNQIKMEALLHENKEQDLIIKPGEEKTISIKFSNTYQYEVGVKKIVFQNIILNYEEYLNNQEEYENVINIEIDL